MSNTIAAVPLFLYGIAIRHLSGIQKGIQQTHAVAEMGLEYASGKGPSGQLYIEWAQQHKTNKLLEAHTCSFMRTLHDRIKSETDLPVGMFREEDLDNALTCITFIAPGYEDFPENLFWLKEILMNLKLASN